MMEWYDYKSITEAYDKYFEECCSEGGFDMESFQDKMSRVLEDNLTQSKDAYNETIQEICDTARDQYSDLCQEYGGEWEGDEDDEL